MSWWANGSVVAHVLASFPRLQPGLALTVLGWLRKMLWGDDDTATAGACARRNGQCPTPSWIVLTSNIMTASTIYARRVYIPILRIGDQVGFSSN
ncbi:MAG: hypothetical protein M1280_00805, partial [Actinobacteria bacterium]|nr:hypothetical protein [Actinomycetota bacterium]